MDWVNYYKIFLSKEEPKQDRTCTNSCSVVCGECEIFEPTQATNPQDLIGRKVRGFKFEDKTTPVYFTKDMEPYIGKVGQIIENHGGHVTVEFDDNTFVYPLSLIHEHLVEEDINVDTSPQIIDLSNVEGVEMMVSYDEESWIYGKVVAKHGECYLTKEGDFVHAKPIEVKKVTMQQVEEKFGCKVEIVKEVSNEQ